MAIIINGSRHAIGLTMTQVFAKLSQLIVIITTLLIVSLISNEQQLVEARYCNFPFQFLSRWFIPAHYDLDLKPSLDGHTHSGLLQILINVVKPDLKSHKRHIILHAGKNLKISNVKLHRVDGFVEHNSLRKNLDTFPEIKVKDFCHDDKYDILIIEMDDGLISEPNQLVAVIQFTAVTQYNGQGLVRINYDDPRAFLDSRRLLYTKFDRFKAHFVYPCFNEPRLKATIKLTLMGISEREFAFTTSHIMHLKNKSKLEMIGTERVRNIEFQKTKPIAMNNFGFIIGPLKYDKLAMFSEQNKDLNLYFMRLRGEYLHNAEITEASLRNVLEQVTSFDKNSIRFPLKYINVIVQPGIGRSMESNFAGSIIVDTERILRKQLNNFDEQLTIIAEMVDMFVRQWYTYTITQELDQDSWFFEALIGLHSQRIIEHIMSQPNQLQFNLLSLSSSASLTLSQSEIFAKRFKSKAMIEDASFESKPLYNPIDYQVEVPSSMSTDLYFSGQKIADLDPDNLDSLTIDDYDLIDDDSVGTTTNTIIKPKRHEIDLSTGQKVKAMAILSNFEQLCGDKWAPVLAKFLRKFAFKVSKFTSLMWLINRECGNGRFEKTAELLLQLAGFSLVKVASLDGNNLLISQEPFLADYTKSVISSDATSTSTSGLKDNKWILSVGFRYGNYLANYRNESTFQLMDNDGDTIVNLASNSFDLNKPGSWLKLNTKASGYYRVFYGDKMLSSVLNAAKNNELSQLDCYNLLEDAVAIVKSGKVGSYYLVQTLKALVDPRTSEFIQELSINAYKTLKQLYIQYDEIHQSLCKLGLELFGKFFYENQMNLSNVITNEGILAKQKIYEQLVMLDYEPIVQRALQINRIPNGLLSLDLRFHSTIFISVVRHGTDQEFAYLLSYLFTPIIQATQDLAEKFIVALACAREQTRLEFTWIKIQNLDGKLIAKFISTLLLSPEGQMFAITDVAQQLPELYGKLDNDLYRLLIIDFCNNLANRTSICSPESPMTAIFGFNDWKDLLNSVRETRRRLFYLQKLDHNKLVV